MKQKPSAPIRPKPSLSPIPSASSSAASAGASPASVDPFLHALRLLPFAFLRPPRTRLKAPAVALPSPTAVLLMLIVTYFAVVSGIVYDVIVEPPGIGSVQDPITRAVKPVVFLQGRVNGQYIIEGLSSGFMFVLGGAGIVLLDLAADRSRPLNVRSALAGFGIAALVAAYSMVMLFIRIKIPGYLW